VINLLLFLGKLYGVSIEDELGNCVKYSPYCPEERELWAFDRSHEVSV